MLWKSVLKINENLYHRKPLNALSIDRFAWDLCDVCASTKKGEIMILHIDDDFAQHKHSVHSFIEFSTLMLSIRSGCIAWISVVKFVCFEFAEWMNEIQTQLKVGMIHLYPIHLICDTLVTSFATCYHISELRNVRGV